MKVAELVEILIKQDQEGEVNLFWSGSPRGEIEGICIGKYGGIDLIGEWSIYRDGNCRFYPEEDIIFDSTGKK